MEDVCYFNTNYVEESIDFSSKMMIEIRCFMGRLQISNHVILGIRESGMIIIEDLDY